MSILRSAVVARAAAARRRFRVGLFGVLLALAILPALAGAALELAVTAGPDPARPGEALRVAITVTNPSGSPSGAVTLQLPYPAHLASLSDALISDDGDCPSTSCETSETVFWSLGVLGPGQGTTVDLPPIVLGGGSAAARRRPGSGSPTRSHLATAPPTR